MVFSLCTNLQERIKGCGCSRGWDPFPVYTAPSPFIVRSSDGFSLYVPQSPAMRTIKSCNMYHRVLQNILWSSMTRTVWPQRCNRDSSDWDGMTQMMWPRKCDRDGATQTVWPRQCDRDLPTVWFLSNGEGVTQTFKRSPFDLIFTIIPCGRIT